MGAAKYYVFSGPRGQPQFFGSNWSREILDFGQAPAGGSFAEVFRKPDDPTCQTAGASANQISRFIIITAPVYLQLVLCTLSQVRSRLGFRPATQTFISTRFAHSELYCQRKNNSSNYAPISAHMRSEPLSRSGAPPEAERLREDLSGVWRLKRAPRSRPQLRTTSQRYDSGPGCASIKTTAATTAYAPTALGRHRCPVPRRSSRRGCAGRRSGGPRRGASPRGRRPPSPAAAPSFTKLVVEKKMPAMARAAL